MSAEALLEPQEQQQSVPNQIMIQLPFGMLGFERVKKYVLMANPKEDPFLWLQMLEGYRKAFLLISPFVVLPGYAPDIPDEDVHFLGLTEPSDALVFTICTLRPSGRHTVNLKGPIVLNRHRMIGKQVIPNNSTDYSTVHPLPVA